VSKGKKEDVVTLQTKHSQELALNFWIVGKGWGGGCSDKKKNGHQKRSHEIVDQKNQGVDEWETRGGEW